MLLSPTKPLTTRQALFLKKLLHAVKDYRPRVSPALINMKLYNNIIVNYDAKPADKLKALFYKFSEDDRLTIKKPHYYSKGSYQELTEKASNIDSLLDYELYQILAPEICEMLSKFHRLKGKEYCQDVTTTSLNQ
ncbi:MAG: hypothetical protein COB50_05080 [Thiotrichales bacterium]|nr:MAG: hypothetical protein COB50_05080 [Thiotrichales bacterium]